MLNNAKNLQNLNVGKQAYEGQSCIPPKTKVLQKNDSESRNIEEDELRLAIAKALRNAPDILIFGIPRR